MHHQIKKEVTNSMKPLQVGLKLAITLRHLATRERYKSLEYHWVVDRTTICKIVLFSAGLTLLNSRMSICATLPFQKTGNRFEEMFRTRWNGHHTLGALDWRNIVMRKLMKSGNKYYNYKGFSLVLLVMVNAEYRFLWVDVG